MSVILNHGYVQARLQFKGEVHYKNFGPDAPVARKQAEQWVKDLKKNLKSGVTAPGKRLSFAKAGELFVSLSGCKDKSCEITIVNKNIVPFFEGKSFDEITPAQVKAWREWRSAQRSTHGGGPIKVGTVNREQAVLSSMFSRIERAVKTGDCEPYQLPKENPCRYVERTGTNLSKRYRVLTLDELGRLKAACGELKNDLWPLIELAITTTLRRKDLLKEVSNVQRAMETGTSKASIRGVQAKTGRLYQLPITIKQEGSVNGAGIVNLTKGKIRTRWAKATKAAGIKDAQWRDLRRTGATLLEEAGYSTQLIKNVLGHASEAMTEKYLDMDVKKIEPLVSHLQNKLNTL